MDKVQRFWIEVQRCEHGETCPNCCWLWTGARTQGGYGLVNIWNEHRKTSTVAHRVSWALTRGEIPRELLVLHNCPDGDNRACVNPQHLWLGTYKDNTQDAIKKGRFATGDRNGARLHPQSYGRHKAKLIASQVIDIRYLTDHGMPRRLLGYIYGVSAMTIGQIVRGKNWKHLPLIVEER